MIAAAAGLTVALKPYLPGHFVIVFLAVALSALLGGRIAGLIATIVGVVSVRLLVTGPDFSFGAVLVDLIAAVILALASILISSLHDSIRSGALAQSRTILEGALDAFIVIDSDSRIMEWNPAAERIFGWRREEVTGRFLYDTIIPVQFRDAHRDGVRRFLATGEGPILNRRLELTALRRDGEEISIELTVMPVESEGGLLMTAFLRDITERTIAAKNLKAERAYFSSLFEGAPEAIALLDHDLRIFRINSEFTRTFGYTSAEATGQVITDLIVPADSREEVFHSTQKVSQGETLGHETTRLRKDGVAIPVSVLATPCKAGDGQDAIYVIYRDITESKRVLDELQITRDRFRALIENSTDMIAILDANGRYMYASPAAQRALGYTDAELIAQRALANVNPEDLPVARNVFGVMLNHPNATVPMELRLRRKDGAWRVVSGTGQNLLDNSAVGGIVVNLRDVTDERALDDQLRKSQRMESIGRLAGGIAHDFNNILTVILTYTDFILADPRFPSELQPDFEEIKKASKYAESLTRQLLAFGRGQSLNPQIINMHQQVSELLPILHRLFDPNIELRVNTEPALWPVNADPTQMQEVLLNLAINARDAMPDGGILSFSTDNCVVAEEAQYRGFAIPAGDYMVLTIGDTGGGMDATTQRKIFEPFFTTKEHGKGTGLGLATVYGIVKQSGGYIWVESSPGAGTRFDIYLERAVAEGVIAGETGERPMPPAATRRILVVDDEPAVRRAIERMLLSEGHTVKIATDGLDALAMFTGNEKSFDLLITDIQMPGMGGRELVAKCRKLRADLKIAYISGFSPESMLSTQMPEPGEVFIAKPFTRDEFLSKIADALSEGGE